MSVDEELVRIDCMITRRQKKNLEKIFGKGKISEGIRLLIGNGTNKYNVSYLESIRNIIRDLNGLVNELIQFEEKEKIRVEKELENKKCKVEELLNKFMKNKEDLQEFHLRNWLDGWKDEMRAFDLTKDEVVSVWKEKYGKQKGGIYNE